MPKSPYQMPFDLAVKFFRSKVPLPTNTWKDVTEGYQAVAFTIASITRLSLLADIQEAIAQQLEKGISPEQFRETFSEIMTRRGWNPGFSPYRINLILSQNIRTAYSFGRWEQQEEPAFKQRHPYRIWQHRDSVVPRPHHLAQNGKVYPADSEIWKAIAPPPFGCKCTFHSLSQRQIEKEGLLVSQPPSLKSIAEPGFSTGFPANLEEQRDQLLTDAIKRLPPNFAKLLQEDADFWDKSEPLEFAASKNPRNCKTGFPCGKSCISRTKKCRQPLTGQALAAATQLQNQIQGSPFSPVSHTPKPAVSTTKINLGLGEDLPVYILTEYLSKPGAADKLQRVQALQAQDKRSQSEILEFEKLRDDVFAAPERELILQSLPTNRRVEIAKSLSMFTNAGATGEVKDYGYIRQADSGNYTLKKAQDKKYKKAVDDISEFLAAAPKHEGEIYRGLNFRFKSAKQNQADISAFVANAQKNGISLDAMSSFSGSLKTAEKFAVPSGQTGKGQSVILRVVKSTKGVDIKSFSKVYEELEVMVPKNVRYKVVGKRVGSGFDEGNKNMVIYLDLEEE